MLGNHFTQAFLWCWASNRRRRRWRRGVLPHPLDQEVGEAEEVQGGLHLGPESGSNLDI